MNRHIALSIVFSLQLLASLANAQVGPIRCITLPSGAQECRAPDGTLVPPPDGRDNGNVGPGRPGRPPVRPPRPRPPARPPRPVPPPQYPAPQPPPSYGLQQFHYEEQDVVMWHQRYLQAPYNSYEQTYAGQQRDQAIARALNSIQGTYAFDGMNRHDVETFASQMNQKCLQAPYGSALQNFYREALIIGYRAMVRSVQAEAQYLSHDWSRLHTLGLEMDQKFLQAAYNSIPQQSYQEARTAALTALPQAVMNEVHRLYDFRQIEDLGLQFDNLHLQAPYNSAKQNKYREIREQVLAAAVRKFQEQGRYQDLYRIQDEYHQKYLQAPYNSARQRYFGQIRDLARQMLGGGFR